MIVIHFLLAEQMYNKIIFNQMISKLVRHTMSSPPPVAKHTCKMSGVSRTLDFGGSNPFRKADLRLFLHMQKRRVSHDAANFII